MIKTALLSIVFLTGICSVATLQAAEAKYIGVKKCKMCHKKQHKTWAGSKHATNFSTLKGDEVKNPECLKCHTTGFNPKDNSYVDPGTTCEACHGPGSLHMKAKKPDKKKTIQLKPTSCANCHNPHVSFGDKAKAARK